MVGARQLAHSTAQVNEMIRHGNIEVVKTEGGEPGEATAGGSLPAPALIIPTPPRGESAEILSAEPWYERTPAVGGASVSAL